MYTHMFKAKAFCILFQNQQSQKGATSKVLTYRKH